MEYFVLFSNSKCFVQYHPYSFSGEFSKSCKFARWLWEKRQFKSVTQNRPLVCAKRTDHSVIHISKERCIGDDSRIFWELFTLNVFNLGARSVISGGFLMPRNLKWKFNIKAQSDHVVWQLNSILRKHKSRKKMHRW